MISRWPVPPLDEAWVEPALAAVDAGDAVCC